MSNSDWTGFTILGTFYDLTHLRPFNHSTVIDGESVNLHITFGHHCFTDEKEYGPRLFKDGSGRYWSKDRYHSSLQLPELLKKVFSSPSTSYAVPYLNKNSNELYHYMEVREDYAVFFDINKPSSPEDLLKIKIISAYELDQWGRGTLPRKHHPLKIGWILSKRIRGEYLLK